MMEIININSPPPTGRLKPYHKLPFTMHELWFLESFSAQVMFAVEHHRKRILELCVFANLLSRHKAKIHAGEDCKLKLTTAEVIAVKRLLLNTPVEAGWTNESSAILFKLDQVTVGVQ